MGFSHGIARLRQTVTRSTSPENPTGAPGRGAQATHGTGLTPGRDLDRPWKVSPSVVIEAGGTHDMANIAGPGEITHIWATCHVDHWRELVLRAYWDDSPEPAIEVPYGDFFCNGLGRFTQVSSTMVAANPNGGFNSYWPMPFLEGARLTLENIGQRDVTVYYQVTYESGATLPHEAGYLHAQWRRSNPVKAGVPHTILTDVAGHGHYVGTYLAWTSNTRGWWGEGEMKFYLDGDGEFPTICGTGTEDYFGGAWNFDVPDKGYTEFTGPYLGLPQVIRPDGLYESQTRFGMYRWHVPDPVIFHNELRVDIQALGVREDGRFRLLRDDVASTALFYLDRPSTGRPTTPTWAELEL